MICYIRVVHVSPESDCSGEILPHALIVPYGFLTLLDKRIKSVLFDLLLALDAELLLDFQLYRQSVGIPAGLTGHKISLHGAVSGDHILDNTCKHVAYMRLAVCGGRAVIECVCGASFPYLKRFIEYVVFFPEILDFFLSCGKVEVGVNFLVHYISFPSDI